MLNFASIQNFIMKKKFSEIMSSLSLEKIKSDRRIFVFAVCLLIATGLWFLNALSKDYSATVNYPVRFVNPPDELFLTSNPPSRLELKVEAHGFSLLRHKLSLSVSPVVLDLTSIWEEQGTAQNILTIQTQHLIGRISDQVSSEITINDISPQVLTFIFDSMAVKNVPVNVNIKTEFKPQFYQNGEITTQPDSIQLTGPASMLDTIQSLNTEKLEIKNIDSDIERTAKILHPENTNINEEKVFVQIPVERFTEKEITVPVQVKNKPQDLNIKLFPAQVKISFLVGLNKYENITAADFNVYVDYNEADYDTEMLEIKIESKPSFIQMLRISPQAVEFLIEID
jgi:ABC-type uncharacterized transport system substrate-binding protein